MITFKDITIGDTFDFVSPDALMNSFTDRVVKISARKYRRLEDGTEYRVGSTSAKVYHVEPAAGLEWLGREQLPVIFRIWRGELTAYFPTLGASSSDWYDVTCYAHIGQHGGARSDFGNRGRLAKPEEYADLLAELRGIYEKPGDDPVELVVVTRQTSAHRNAREAEFRRMKEATEGNY